MTSEPVVPPPGWPADHPDGDWSAPGWAPPRRNGPGVASFFLGLLALPAVVFIWPGLVMAAVAVALGVIGRRRVERGEADTHGLATAGLAFGALALALSVAWGTIVYFAGVREQRDYDACLAGGRSSENCLRDFDPAEP